jgi:hypothetical protein
MYGDQVFLVMHHCLALVTLNLGQWAQEVSFTGKMILYSQFSQKITSNIHGMKLKIKKLQIIHMVGKK